MANIEVLTLAGIDYNQGLQRFSGNAMIYEKFLKKLVDDQNFTGLKEKITNKEYDTAFTMVHSLKGVTGNLSCNRLYNSLVELTEELRNGNPSANVLTLYQVVEQNYHDTIDAINKYFG